ncbi:MAG: hypothetical protein Q9M30_03535 [Mariprofundaceae bacterium]|nr:hypothetical protein [Mariprofundaceae bacterium]
MKIRPGQSIGPQKRTSSSASTGTDGHFQVLLDQEINAVAEKQTEPRHEGRETANRPRELIDSATRLLDDAITQIETSDGPNQETIASLQELRSELAGLGTDDATTREAGTILSVETERLKSW